MSPLLPIYSASNFLTLSSVPPHTHSYSPHSSHHHALFTPSATLPIPSAHPQPLLMPLATLITPSATLPIPSSYPQSLSSLSSSHPHALLPPSVIHHALLTPSCHSSYPPHTLSHSPHHTFMPSSYPQPLSSYPPHTLCHSPHTLVYSPHTLFSYPHPLSYYSHHTLSHSPHTLMSFSHPHIYILTQYMVYIATL